MIKRFELKPWGIRTACRAAMAALLILAPSTGFADEVQHAPEDARDVPDFSAFQIVVDRNIFSPARQAPVPEAERQAAAAEAPPPEFRGRTLRLMGTVVRNDLRVALFEGGGAPSDGVKPGETVAGYTVAGVRTHGVTLDGAGETVELTVGAGLKEQEDGRWSVVDAVAAATRSPEPSPSEEDKGAEATSETSNETDAGGSNDLLERLRERRRRELGQ